MDSTELLLKQIALENSGSERWSCLVDLYEARAQATLSFIQGIPEETASIKLILGSGLGQQSELTVGLLDFIGNFSD